MMNRLVTRKRSLGLEGVKLLIATGGLAATISFWSFFSNQDRASALNKVEQAATAQPTSQLSLFLPPLPTLVAFELGGDPVQIAASNELTTQDLRSVSAPVAALPNNSNPLVVQGSRASSSAPAAPASRPSTGTGSS
ncbi:MAG TPA: hypothetical protein VI703_02805 [Anaerolineales bacterium]|nr:hypothetical protein [Anaerolineales bacterium]